MSDVMEILREIEIGNVKLIVKQLFDEYPDLSWLGEYTNNPPAGVRVIDRQKKGDWERGQYRYFVPGISFEEHRKGLIEMGYNPHYAASEAGYYNNRDYKRFEDYNRDVWTMTGIAAIIEVDGVEIAHSSLWGIESDAGDDYIAEITHCETRSALKEAREWLGRRTIGDNK